MSRTIYQSLSKKEVGNWQKGKREEWRKNADFWIKIIRKNLDPYRLKVTNKAILETLKGKKNIKILN